MSSEGTFPAAGGAVVGLLCSRMQRIVSGRWFRESWIQLVGQNGIWKRKARGLRLFDLVLSFTQEKALILRLYIKI